MTQQEEGRTGQGAANPKDRQSTARENSAKELNSQASNGLPIESVDPWPDPVGGLALLHALVAVFHRFLVLPSGAAELLALFAVYTYVYDYFDISPRLVVWSP